MDVEMVESEKPKNSDSVDLHGDQALDNTQEASESLLAGATEQNFENLVPEIGMDNEASSENLLTETASENLLSINSEQNTVNMVPETMDMDINSENLVPETEPDLNESAIDTEEPNSTNQPASVKENASVFGPRLSQLPLARIKHIMKMDPDVHMASQV